MLARIRALVLKESGQDLIEVALLTALISIVSIVALRTFGYEIGVFFLQLRGVFG